MIRGMWLYNPLFIYRSPSPLSAKCSCGREGFAFAKEGASSNRKKRNLKNQRKKISMDQKMVYPRHVQIYIHACMHAPLSSAKRLHPPIHPPPARSAPLRPMTKPPGRSPTPISSETPGHIGESESAGGDDVWCDMRRHIPRTSIMQVRERKGQGDRNPSLSAGRVLSGARASSAAVDVVSNLFAKTSIPWVACFFFFWRRRRRSWRRCRCFYGGWRIKVAGAVF